MSLDFLPGKRFCDVPPASKRALVL